MNVIFLDLEMNKSPDNSRTTKIIQVGGCVADVSNEIIREEFSYDIKIDEPLHEFITRLTGITDYQLSKGITLQEAYEGMKALKEKYQCERNLWTFGGGDSQELRKQLNYPQDWLFGDRWFDVKTVYQTWRIATNQSYRAGLRKCLVRMGDHFVGKAHTARCDGVNAFRLYCLLKRKMVP